MPQGLGSLDVAHDAHHTRSPRPCTGSARFWYSSPLSCRAPLLVCPTSLERDRYASADVDLRWCMRPTSSAASANSSSSSNHWVSRSCFLSTTWLLQSKCLRHGPMLIPLSLRQPLTSLVSALFCGCRVLKPSATSIGLTKMVPQVPRSPVFDQPKHTSLGLADHRTVPIHRIIFIFTVSSSGISHSPCTQTASRSL